LYRSMKGLGTDEKTLTRILATKTRDELQEIKKSFEQKYSKTLASFIKGDTSGHFEDLLLSLIEDKADYDAKLVHDAIKGLGTNDDELVEVICTRNNSEMKAMKASYQKLYHVDMEKDVSGDTSGDYKNILLQLCKAERNETQAVNVEEAKKDAKYLYEQGEGRLGTNEKAFIDILCHRSFPQLLTIGNCYGSQTGHSLERGIAKETSGNFKKCLTILMTPREEFFAEAIRKSVEGAGTNDHKLIRNLCYLSNNKDLIRAVNAYYMHKYKHNLENDVGGDTSGWYKKTCVQLIQNRVNL